MGAALSREHGRISIGGTVSVTGTAADATIPNPGYRATAVFPVTLRLFAPTTNTDLVYWSLTGTAVSGTGAPVRPGEEVTIGGGTGRLSMVSASGTQSIEIIAHYA